MVSLSVCLSRSAHPNLCRNWIAVPDQDRLVRAAQPNRLWCTVPPVSRRGPHFYPGTHLSPITHLHMLYTLYEVVGLCLSYFDTTFIKLTPRQLHHPPPEIQLPTHLLVQLENDPLIGHHCGHWTPPTEEERIRISLSDLKSSGWDVDDLLLLLHLRRWHTFKHPTGNLWNSGLLCRLYLFFCIFTLFSSVISI